MHLGHYFRWPRYRSVSKQDLPKHHSMATSKRQAHGSDHPQKLGDAFTQKHEGKSNVLHRNHFPSFYRLQLLTKHQVHEADGQHSFWV